jgi:hypothetical protein
MILRVMMLRSRLVVLSCAAVACAALPVFAQKNLVKPMAGPRATALQVTPVYVSPDPDSQRLLRVQTGRELVVAEKSGEWYRVYTNTDVQEEAENDPDAPMVGGDSLPPPVSGWVQAKGIVEETTPNGDQIIMGAAANEESLASDPRGPANSAQAARLLYRRVAEMFPNSPLAPEAAWRAADIKWQIDKADNATLPSSHSREAYLRPQMNEDEIKKVIKTYPRTKWAALAAFDLIDNKLCGNWEATPECPEKEADVYLKYADDFPDGPRTARALYEVVYRLGALTNMYESAGKHDRAEKAHRDAASIAERLRTKFPDSEYAWRGGALVYKLDEGIPVYGIDLQ